MVKAVVKDKGNQESRGVVNQKKKELSIQRVKGLVLNRTMKKGKQEKNGINLAVKREIQEGCGRLKNVQEEAPQYENKKS